MTGDDPFSTLGLPVDASADDVRAARRRLARTLHPDVGGDAERMRAVNAAAAAALARIAGQPDAPAPPSGEPSGRVAHDSPSFTIEALPVEAFEALLVVTSWLGEVLVDDPPYVLEAHLTDPAPCWCRLELLPEAGASTVVLTVAGVDGGPAPHLDDVRDAWVANLNRLDWDHLDGTHPQPPPPSPPA